MSIPIVLPVSAEDKTRLEGCSEIVLTQKDGGWLSYKILNSTNIERGALLHVWGTIVQSTLHQSKWQNLQKGFLSTCGGKNLFNSFTKDLEKLG